MWSVSTAIWAWTGLVSEDVSPADLAQLSYSVYAHESGIVIKVSGLSDKLPRLLEVIMDHLVELKVR